MYLELFPPEKVLKLYFSTVINWLKSLSLNLNVFRLFTRWFKMRWWSSGPIWFDFVRRPDSYAIIQIWRLNHFRILLNYRSKIPSNDQKCREIVFFIRICLQKNYTGDLDGIMPNFVLEFGIFDQKLWINGFIWHSGDATGDGTLLQMFQIEFRKHNLKETHLE